MNARPRSRCGTYAGHSSHKYRDEIPCDDCIRANREYAREYARTHRTSRAGVIPEQVRRMPESRDELLPCRQFDPDNWFSKSGNNMAVAKAWCQRCPILDACLDYALQYDVDGIWGALTARERRAIQKADGIRPVSILSEVAQA